MDSENLAYKLAQLQYSISVDHHCLGVGITKICQRHKISHKLFKFLLLNENETNSLPDSCLDWKWPARSNTDYTSIEF